MAAPSSEPRVRLPAGTWVVIPAHNESAVIAGVIRDVRSIAECVVVDDCSTDGTKSAAERAGAVVLRHLINRGQGAALQTGIEFALSRGASYVVTMDADGQHDASDLHALLAPIVAGDADAVLGSRFLEHAGHIPRARRFLLRLAVLFTRVVSGMRVSDTHNGLRAFTREVSMHLHLTLDRMAHASELLDQIRASGARYVEIPVHVRYTDYSRKKGQRGSEAVRVAVEYLIGRWLQ